MRRGEALAAATVGVVVMTVGLVWLFGAWPLVAVGACLVVAALLLPNEPRHTATGDEDGGGRT